MMTVLEQLAARITADPVWTEMIDDYASDSADTPTCQDWGRKGGSHYKDGKSSRNGHGHRRDREGC
jgi:hypothetical protein